MFSVTSDFNFNAYASGTAARGGSIIDIRPRNRKFTTGKLTSSESNGKLRGNSFCGKRKSQKPKTRSPRPPNSR